MLRVQFYRNLADFSPVAHLDGVGEGVGDSPVPIQGDDTQVEDRSRRGQNICKIEVMKYIGRSREMIHRWRIEAVEARTSVKERS